MTVHDILPNKSILKTVEVAKAFRVHPRSITRQAEIWQDTGGLEGLPSFRFCGQWRFCRDQLLEHIARQKNNSATADNSDTSAKPANVISRSKVIKN